MIPIYPTEIQKFDSEKFQFQPANFRILKHQVNGTILKVLIEFRSQANSKIKALWDERKSKLYLTSSKNNPETTERRTNYGIGLIKAKVNQAWIKLDLSALIPKKDVCIYKREPKMF